MKYLVRGAILGVSGFLAGAEVTALARGVGGLTDPTNFTVGYVLGLCGWLLGMGAWEAWVRDWLGLQKKELGLQGWRRYLGFCTDHKVIGIQYLATFIVVMLVAGLLAMVMRAELYGPGKDFLSADAYNQTMSLHGILMVAFAVAAVLGGFGNYLVPLMIGAEDMAFPRLNALSYWLVPPVAVLLLSSPLAGGFDTGWTAYPPLSVVNKAGQVFFILAVITFGLSSILGGLNFLATITTMRAPGMSWSRMPIFVWSVFAASILSVLVTQYFAASLLMILLDRIAGTTFFDPAGGGDPLLYQHVFWFYSHPAVYIMILPGFGILLEVIAHFARKPLFGYRMAVGGFLAIVVLSVIVWAHHMFTSGMPDWMHAPFMVTTELISIPTGLVFFSALGTLWRGKLVFRTPLLFAVAMVFNFLIGGLTGIFLADVATDIQLQDTYFVVAHFHYTIMGGEVFAFLAGVFFWFPKVTGRRYNETVGKITAVGSFLLFNALYIPMFWAGLHGMNRRIATYDPSLAPTNRFISLVAFGLGVMFLLFAWNLVWSALKGERAPANPWRATTLEWLVPSPPPEHNFPSPPMVVGEPYGYGTGNGQHAVVAPAEEN